MASLQATQNPSASQSRVGHFLTFVAIAGGAILFAPTAGPVMATGRPQAVPTVVAAAPAAALSQVVYRPSYLQPAAQQDPCCVISPDIAVQLIRQTLARLPGIGDVSVDAAAGTLTVSYDPAQVLEEQITALLTEEYFLP